MEKLILFHGTPDRIVVPTFGKGEEKHDYGQGFYLSESIDLAKEWAVCRPNEEAGCTSTNLKQMAFEFWIFRKKASYLGWRN